MDNSIMFGILISIIAFEIGLYVNKKTKLALLNPLFISTAIIIFVLVHFNISLETYNEGADFISFFLGPATVILAVPLYKQLDILKQNLMPILIGVSVGCIGALSSVVILDKMFHLDYTIAASMLPKSITTPIGIEISSQLNAIPAITVGAIVITGIVGAIIGPFICKIFKIHDEVAVGLAIGTSSHALGTTKAMELGETQGAMSSLAIGISGIATVILAPIFATFLS